MKKVIIVFLISTFTILQAQDRRIPGPGQNPEDIKLYPTDIPKEWVRDNMRKQYKDVEAQYEKRKQEIKQLDNNEKIKYYKEFNDLLEKYLNLKKTIELEDVFGSGF